MRSIDLALALVPVLLASASPLETMANEAAEKRFRLADLFELEVASDESTLCSH